MSNVSTDQRDPESEYRGRLKILRETETRYKQTAGKLGPATLFFLAVSIVSAGWILTTRISAIYWVLLPVALLIFFAINHERVIHAIRASSRRIVFYERCLARIGDKWMGTGETGDRFSDPSHSYARDLDIFGVGSLFELLCTARTRAGEEILARWLLAPAPPDEVRLRNAAVSELRTRLDLREDLAVLGKDFRSGVQPEALSAWGEGSSTLRPGILQIVSALLAFLWLCSLLAWAIFNLKYPALLISVVNLGIASMLRRQTSARAYAIEES